MAADETTLVVARLVEGEWPVLRALRLAALRADPTAFASTVERELAFDEATWRERSGGPNPSFVARSGTDVVGLAGGYRDGNGGFWLVSMWVAPAWRRRGAASMLVAEVVAWAGRQGAPAIRLWVTADNAPGRRCYTRAGFRLTGQTQPLPSRPDLEEVEMVLEVRRWGRP